MQVKSIADCSKGVLCNAFNLHKLAYVIKIFVLSIFEWLFYTGFTVEILKLVPEDEQVSVSPTWL